MRGVYNMDVSIILSSYNRYPHILLSLYSLEKQTYDLSKMEVIVIDDASTDHTHLLTHYHPAYQFKYIRNELNSGLSAARNKGLKMATGEIIIFLDAEMIVDPDYVSNNYRHHLTEDNAVVISKTVKRVYSFLFPEFNSRQKMELEGLLKKHKEVKNRLKLVFKENHQLSDTINLEQMLKNLKSSLPILNRTDIDNFSGLNPYTAPKKDLTNILTQLGDKFENSRIAWMACFGNISLKKRIIKKAGGFDEHFKDWGEEDREFAYRLFKAGAKFVVDDDLKRYHQEHPEPPNKKKGQNKNKIYLQQKHPDIDVCIRSLNFITKNDFKFMEKILEEHEILSNQFPNRFNDFKKSIILMLQQITILKSDNKKIKNLLKNSGIEADNKKRKTIFLERTEIEAYGKYNNLIQLFDLLCNR